MAGTYLRYGSRHRHSSSSLRHKFVQRHVTSPTFVIGARIIIDKRIFRLGLKKKLNVADIGFTRGRVEAVVVIPSRCKEKPFVGEVYLHKKREIRRSSGQSLILTDKKVFTCR